MLWSMHVSCSGSRCAEPGCHIRIFTIDIIDYVVYNIYGFTETIR